MSSFRSQLCLAAVVVSAALQGAVSAATIKIEDISAIPYSEITTLHASGDQPTGVVEKFIPAAGSNYWLITFRVTPEWDEATKNMNFDSDSFGFFDGATKVKHIGGLMQFGVVERYYGAPYLYRPDNWKEQKSPGQWRKILVEIPSDKKELVLKMTQLVYDEADMQAPPKKTPYTAAVKLAGEPKPYNVNDFVEIVVRGVKLLDFVEDKNEYEKTAPIRKIVNEGGSIMQLTVQITPKQHNNTEEKGFYWTPGVFGLSFGRGGRAVCIGARQYGSISADAGEAIQQTDGEIWNAKTVSIYFPVPSNLKTFDVTYMGQKVSVGEVK